MKELIACVCGKKISKKYSKKNRTMCYSVGTGFHEWICPNCGRRYTESIKETINMD